jgi:hypothetical protein
MTDAPRFEKRDMAGATFHICKLAGASFDDVNIHGLTIFGVDIHALIQAEFKKGRPQNGRYRSRYLGSGNSNPAMASPMSSILDCRAAWASRRP